MEAVAAEAGVGIEWIERFAAPVFAEQAAAAARAAQLTLRLPRRGESSRPLASSVLCNLADRGIRLAEDEFAAAWSALQHAPDEWLIRFRYSSGGRELDAEWILNPVTRTLSSRSRLATELGFVDSERHALPDLEPAKRVGAARQAAPAGEAAPVEKAAPVKKAAPVEKIAAVRNAVAPKKAPVVGKVAPAQEVGAARKVGVAGKIGAAGKVGAARKVGAAKQVAVAKQVAAVGKVAPARKVAVAKQVAAVGKVAPARQVAAVAIPALDRPARDRRADTGVPREGM